MLFSDFRYQLLCIEGLTLSYFHFDPEIEITLFRLKNIKADNTKMEDHDSDRFNEGHSDHNEMLGIRESTLGDCCSVTPRNIP